MHQRPPSTSIRFAEALTWVVRGWGPPGTRSTVACNPRDVAAVAVVVDDARPCAGDDGSGAVRVDADGASSHPARRVPAGSRCAEATSRFRGSSSRGCDRHLHRPCRRDNPSSGCPTRNFRPLKHKREPGTVSEPLRISRPPPPPPYSAMSRCCCTCSCMRLNGTGAASQIVLIARGKWYCALMHLVAATRRERVSRGWPRVRFRKL